MFRSTGGREPHVERSPPPSPSASVASFDGQPGPYSDWAAHNRQRSESVSSSQSHAAGPLMGLGFASGQGGQGGNTRDGVDGWRRNGGQPGGPQLGMQEDGSRIEVRIHSHVLLVIRGCRATKQLWTPG